MLLFRPFTLASLLQLLTSLSRKTSCGIAELFPLRFEYVLGVFVALKKQLEDEEKERKKQEDEQSGKIDMASYSSQANGMMRQAMSSVPHMPSMPSVPKI